MSTFPDDEAPRAAAASIVKQTAAEANSSTAISGAVTGDRGSGQDPVVEGAGGQSPSGESTGNLVVCCVHATEGADIEKIAKDLRATCPS